MSLHKVVIKQYQDLVDKAAASTKEVSTPPEGWLCTVRKALNMPVSKLAKRLRVGRATIYQAEKGELTGSVTLKTLNKIAQAMNCRLVYAIVPESDVHSLIKSQAKLMAQTIVHQANVHMALEDQSLSQADVEREIERLTHKIMNEDDSELWDTKWSK